MNDNKLKTLKDLDWWKVPDINKELSVECYRLKQEAIKWIKELEKEIKLFETNPEYHNEIMKEYYRSGQFNSILIKNSEQILWIKHFFNITEEDLK